MNTNCKANISGYYRYRNHVGKHRRRVKWFDRRSRKHKEATYESPKIVLPSKLNHLIGKTYNIYMGTVEIHVKTASKSLPIEFKEEGEALILLFHKD